MAAPQKYSSKAEIFKKYQVALKFGTDRWMEPEDYDAFLGKLKTEHRARISKFPELVKGLRTTDRLSVGMFYELPVGDERAVQFVLLQHETGPEWFAVLDPAMLEVVKWAAGTAAGAAIGAAMSTYVKAALTGIHQVVRDTWLSVTKAKISYVEIRTEKKGVMRIKFDKFDIYQLECLAVHWDRISHLSETNRPCFGGELYTPDSRTEQSEVRQEGAPRPLPGSD
jgi:hypothetical protein